MHDFKRFPELTNSQMELYYFDSPHKQITEDFTARVIKVSDGDTIRAKTNFRNFNFPIRFAKIAAPELDERGGLESKKWLESQILNQDVEVIVNVKNRVGKFGRLLGEVLFRGMNMGEESINQGHAVDFEQREGAIMPEFEVMKL